jgi:hypothetical protein
MRKPVVMTVLLFLVIAAAHIWTIAYHSQWPSIDSDVSYTSLAQAFLHGQLSLPEKPDPRLLALPDPYDSAANTGFRLHDAAFFDGKYYLYWGPVPALLTAAVCLATGVSHPNVGDQYLVLFFRLGIVAMAAILILQIRKRYYARQPLDTAFVVILSLGLGTPLIFTLSTPQVYNAEITGGQLFLLAGLCAAWFFLNGGGQRWLVMAGMAWTLAAGSRISLAPAVGAIMLCTLLAIRRRDREQHSGWPALALAMPLLFGAAIYAGYNVERFHSWFDFGWRYQLSQLNQHSAVMSDFFSVRHVIPDLLSYIAAAPLWLRRFPYVRAVNPIWVDFLFHHFRHRFNVEPLIGIAWSQPFLVFALAAFLPARNGDSRLEWLRICLTLAVVLGAAPALMIGYTTMRYLMDAIPCFTILAAIGYWQLAKRLENHPEIVREIRSAARLVVLAQCALGLLLTFSV